MSKLSTQQRKLMYLIGIMILLVPIIQLSLPSDGINKHSGGILSQKRSQYDLGESDLGDVDLPAGELDIHLRDRLGGVLLHVPH